MVNDQLDAQFFSMYLFHFSTCFEQTRAHHQEDQLYQYNVWYIYFISIHVSSKPVLIIRRINCINTMSGIFISLLYMFLANSCSSSGGSIVSIRLVYLFHYSTCFEQTRAHHQEDQLYQYNIWYMSLCVGDRFVFAMQKKQNKYTNAWTSKQNSTRTVQPSGMKNMQNEKTRNGHLHSVTYTRCCIDTIDPPDDEHGGCSKHVENWNKYIEKNCALIWSFTMNHSRMHECGVSVYDLETPSMRCLRLLMGCCGTGECEKKVVL